MKKLNSIENIYFKNDKVYLNEIPISVGENLIEWLENYSNLSYEYSSYIDNSPEYMRCEFINYESLIIRTENNIITDISVYLYLYQSSPYFKGNVYIENSRLEKQFLSDDIEKYFLDIKTKRRPSKSFDRFIPQESIDYPINEMVKIEISVGRNPMYVSSISLKKIKV